MSSNLIIFQLSIIVVLMTTLISTANIPQATSLITEMSSSYADDDRNPTSVLSDHNNNNIPSSSKHNMLINDEIFSNEQEEDDDDDDYLKAIWPELINKRYADKVMRSDNRLWAIPYRFGKRSAMPYRFGKRAGMHFRLGK